VTTDGNTEPSEINQPQVFRPRRRANTYYHNLYLTLDEDPAIQTYFEGIKGRRRNRGYLSSDTALCAHEAMRRFLEYLELPITDHSYSDLIAEKRNNPSSQRIDNKPRLTDDGN
jgi:hypothetical protein